MMFISVGGQRRKLTHATQYLIKWRGDSRSAAQKRVKTALHPYWYADVVFEEFPVIGTRLSIDFYNANKRIAIEVDGEQHYAMNDHFHHGCPKKFLDQLKRDQIKEDFCLANKIRLVRLLDTETVTKELLKQHDLI